MPVADQHGKRRSCRGPLYCWPRGFRVTDGVQLRAAVIDNYELGCASTAKLINECVADTRVFLIEVFVAMVSSAGVTLVHYRQCAVRKFEPNNPSGTTDETPILARRPGTTSRSSSRAARIFPRPRPAPPFPTELYIAAFGARRLWRNHEIRDCQRVRNKTWHPPAYFVRSSRS